MTGMAKRSRKFTTSDIHTNIGSLKKLIPGARMLMMVVTKFTEATSEARPTIWRPIAKKFTPLGSGRPWVDRFA